ncbi:MAG: T9SS type A sorting domain-containing protein [Bacteroidota bacterium]|nr:T9SS type A sorting domain-containing protein [Bacteroidota bacterium]
MKAIFTLILLGVTSCFSLDAAPHFLSPSSLDFAELRCNLYQLVSNGTAILLDGNLTQYDSSFSDTIDGMDARKMTNPSENWGMLRSNYTLVVERRHSIANTDSIFIKMWNMHVLNYQVEIIAANLNKPGRTGHLEDKYLHTSTQIQLNDTTRVRFSVTSDPASMASDRFRIIFTAPYTLNGLLPLTFTNIKAWNINSYNNIQWNTANETNVDQYSVQRSGDGIHYQSVSATKAKNLYAESYAWTDLTPAKVNNYYRVQSTDMDGKMSYSPVIRLEGVNNARNGFGVYPNPVVGNTINLSFNNQQPGIYSIRLINSLGQIFPAGIIRKEQGNNIESIHPGSNIPSGVYRLQIMSPSGKNTEIPVVLK